MAIDDLIKVSKTEAKKTKAKTKKVPAKGKNATPVAAKGKKGKKDNKAKDGNKMDVQAAGRAKKEAKSKASANVKRGNLMAAKRGVAPKLDTNAIQKTIKKEAEKLAKKMVASTTAGKGKGNGLGGRKSKTVKIQFKAADLKKGTSQNTVKQLQGILSKSPKSRSKGGNSGRGGGGSGRKIILK